MYVAMQLVRNVNNLTSFTEDETSENEWGTLTMHFVVKKILFIINFTSFMNFRINKKSECIFQCLLCF